MKFLKWWWPMISGLIMASFFAFIAEQAILAMPFGDAASGFPPPYSWASYVYLTMASLVYTIAGQFFWSRFLLRRSCFFCGTFMTKHKLMDGGNSYTCPKFQEHMKDPKFWKARK